MTHGFSPPSKSTSARLNMIADEMERNRSWTIFHATGGVQLIKLDRTRLVNLASTAVVCAQRNWNVWPCLHKTWRAMRAEKCNEKAIFHGTNFHMQTSLNVYLKNFHFHFSPWHRSLLFNVCALVAEADTRDTKDLFFPWRIESHQLSGRFYEVLRFWFLDSRPTTSQLMSLNINQRQLSNNKKKKTHQTSTWHTQSSFRRFGCDCCCSLPFMVAVICWSRKRLCPLGTHNCIIVDFCGRGLLLRLTKRTNTTDDIIGEYKISTQLATYESKALFFPLSIAFAIVEPTENVSSRLSTRRGLESKSNFN